MKIFEYQNTFWHQVPPRSFIIENVYNRTFSNAFGEAVFTEGICLMLYEISIDKSTVHCTPLECISIESLFGK